eukprot:gene11811-biopygen6394
MGCACGAEHAALVVRWQDDTLFVQRVPRGLPVAEWRARLAAVYPPSLELEWSPATGDGGAGAEVVWTDLVVGASDAGVYVLPREARFADAADFKRVAPRVSLRWLWKGAFSVPMNHFVRLKDVGCLAWRVWDVRAVLLLLAGYSWREVSNAAAQALRRRIDAAQGCEKNVAGSVIAFCWIGRILSLLLVPVPRTGRWCSVQLRTVTPGSRCRSAAI